MRASRLSATGIECLESVVALKRRLCRALMPFSRISRSTRRRPMRWPLPEFPVHTPRAVGGLDLRVDALHQGHGLRVRQTRALGLATALPGAVAADADVQHLAQVGQRVLEALRIDPGVLHSASFAKYAVAFLIFRHASSARVLRAQPGQLHLLGRHGLGASPYELASISRLHPVAQRLLDQAQFPDATPMPMAWACLTACSLNSAVYSCFGIFFTSLPSGLDTNHRPLEDENGRQLTTQDGAVFKRQKYSLKRHF